jgi:PAS domain S-box-containing protein
MNEKEHIKILIIEDNMGDFLLIKDYLEENLDDLKLVHAKRFSEAINFLDDQSVLFDLVLLDLTLPDKTGEELIVEIVEKCPQIPVIVLTGFSDLDFSVKSLSFKISDYLLKDDINAGSLFKSIKFNIERKKTNLKLEESEKRYSNLFQLSPQPMWILDIKTYSFLQVNKAAIDHYQYSENEFLNMSLFNIVIDDFSADENLKKTNEISQTANIYKGRFRHKKKNNEIIDVDVYSSLISINEVDYESVIAIDVTEKIKLEYKITKAIISTCLLYTSDAADDIL